MGICARSTSMAGINLDKFFADSGLAILCPLDTDEDDEETAKFLEAWALAIAPYEIYQAGGCKDVTFKARIDAGTITAGEQQSFVDRLVRKRANGGSSPARPHPLDNLDWETPAQDENDITSWNARMIALGQMQDCIRLTAHGPSPTNAMDSLRRRINAVGPSETSSALGTATGLSAIREGAAATASLANGRTLGQAIAMSDAQSDATTIGPGRSLSQSDRSSPRFSCIRQTGWVAPHASRSRSLDPSGPYHTGSETKEDS